MMGSVARFFNSFIGIAPFEKRSTANVLGQKYYTIIGSAASWLDFLVHFYNCFSIFIIASQKKRNDQLPVYLNFSASERRFLHFDGDGLGSRPEVLFLSNNTSQKAV